MSNVNLTNFASQYFQNKPVSESCQGWNGGNADDARNYVSDLFPDVQFMFVKEGEDGTTLFYNDDTGELLAAMDKDGNIFAYEDGEVVIYEVISQAEGPADTDAASAVGKAQVVGDSKPEEGDQFKGTDASPDAPQTDATTALSSAVKFFGDLLGFTDGPESKAMKGGQCVEPNQSLPEDGMCMEPGHGECDPENPDHEGYIPPEGEDPFGWFWEWWGDGDGESTAPSEPSEEKNAGASSSGAVSSADKDDEHTVKNDPDKEKPTTETEESSGSGTYSFGGGSGEGATNNEGGTSGGGSGGGGVPAYGDGQEIRANVPPIVQQPDEMSATPQIDDSLKPDPISLGQHECIDANASAHSVSNSSDPDAIVVSPLGGIVVGANGVFDRVADAPIPEGTSSKVGAALFTKTSGDKQVATVKERLDDAKIKSKDKPGKVVAGRKHRRRRPHATSRRLGGMHLNIRLSGGASPEMSDAEAAEEVVKHLGAIPSTAALLAMASSLIGFVAHDKATDAKIEHVVAQGDPNHHGGGEDGDGRGKNQNGDDDSNDKDDDLKSFTTAPVMFA